MVTLRHLQAFAKNKENLRPSERTDENTGIFCDAEYISNLFFYECLKLFVPVDQVLVLVAMAGNNVFDERLRVGNPQPILISKQTDGGENRGEQLLSVFKAEALIQLAL